MGKLIGELLVEAKAITREKLDEALRMPREPGKKLGQVLLEKGYITEAHLTQCLSFQLSVPWVSLYHIDFSRQLLSRIPREIAERYCLVPIYVRNVKGSGDTLYVAIEDPMNQVAMNEASKAAGLPVRPMIASPADIRSAIRVYYGPQDGEAVSLQPTTAPATQPEKPTTPPERKPEPPPLPPKRQKMPSMSDGAPPPTKAVPPSRPPGRSVSRPPVGPPSSPPNRPGIPEASGALPHFPSSQDDELAAELGADLDIPPPPMRDDSVDHPDASPEIEAHEHDITTPGRKGPRMVALTLLDGTSLALPARPRRRSEAPPTPLDGMSDQLTSRDLISALRALSHGADVSEILGNDVHWESMFAALLSLLLKKGIIADWEFIDELRKV